MAAIKIPTFAGMVPAVDPRLLLPQNASYSENTWLYSGALDGLPRERLLHTLANPNAKVAFRLPGNEDDTTYLYDSYWVEFENPDTSFFRAPVAGDTFRRHYWASPSMLPSYNTYDRILAGDPPWLLGIPQPGSLAGSATGGSSTTNISRAYVTTLVSAYGEEGPASDPILLNGKEDAAFSVIIAGVQASDMGLNRNITKVNLYRTIVSAQGTVTYYLVGQYDAQTGSRTVNDTLTDSALASKPILESTAWTAPPAMDGMVVMPNGIIAGWVQNELWFSEPYRPHAWPAAYSLTVENDIVGLAVANQTLVICTKGKPLTASGVSPAAITTSTLTSLEPCLSRGSILATEEGVYYTSPSGLMLVNPGRAENLTRKVISKDKWSAIALVAKSRAARVGTAYYAFGTGSPKVFNENAFQQDMVQTENTTGSDRGFLVDPSNEVAGFNYLSMNNTVGNVYNDYMSNEVLIIRNNAVYWLDQRTGYEMRAYKWASKEFQTPRALNFSVFKVYFQKPTDFTWENDRNNAVDQVFDPETQLAIVRIYADGKVILAHELREPGELHRAPSGFKASFWKIEIEARVRVNDFQMATSAKELASV